MADTTHTSRIAATTGHAGERDRPSSPITAAARATPNINASGHRAAHPPPIAAMAKATTARSESGCHRSAAAGS